MESWISQFMAATKLYQVMFMPSWVDIVTDKLKVITRLLWTYWESKNIMSRISEERETTDFFFFLEGVVLVCWKYLAENVDVDTAVKFI